MKRDRTALIFASEGGHLEMVEALVTAGADVNAKDNVSRLLLGI